MKHGLQGRFSKASAAEARRDYPEAAGIYNSILAKFPNNTRARRALQALEKKIAAMVSPVTQLEYDALLAIYQSGDWVQAERRALALVQTNPGQPAFHNVHGAALLQLKRPAEAEQAFRRSIALRPEVPDGHNNLGNALKDQGRIDEARASYERALKLFPDYADCWNNLGTVHQANQDWDEALAAYDKAMALRPDYVDAINNRATALMAMKRYAEAEETFRRALELAPNYAQIHGNHGQVLLEQERYPEAIAAYEKAVGLLPTYAEGWNNLGVALRRSGRTEEALAAYEKAMALSPDVARARGNKAGLLLAEGMVEGAAEEFLAAIETDPNDVEAIHGLAIILFDSADYAQALALFDRVLELKPDHPFAINNRGNCLRAMGWLSEAEQSYSLAVKEQPFQAIMWANLGSARQDLGRPSEAIEAYTYALELDPTLAECRVQRLHQRARLCDWSEMAGIGAELALSEGQKEVPAAFPILGMLDDPAYQLRRAQAMAGRWAAVAPKVYPPRPGRADGRRIRIGYFSGDFHDHAIMYLASGLFREHGRNRFEVFGYSSGAVRRGPMRERAEADIEHFHDVLEVSDPDLLDMVRAHDLDIAVDVSGYTKGYRTALFANRVAPVQINYLGFPGTMGSTFMDYVVVDPLLVAPEEREFVSENLLVMPHCYQPNDSTRPVSEAPLSRADFELPEDGFVFCCFNQGFKITPREFNIWMQLLKAVPDAVLWLMAGDPVVKTNLRREAKARGVDPARLVFAGHMPNDLHLARHRLADLFLDTFAYTAHTTMSDALWAGLPAITRLGRQFAARVGGSLLTATGLEELITRTDEEYERLALTLATDRGRLAGIRARLAANLPTAPLFDTLGYTRDLERAYLAVLKRHGQGLPPADLAVASLT